MTMNDFAAFIVLGLFAAPGATADDWYTQGSFHPVERIPLTLVNTLDFDRKDCPVVIPREALPIADLHEMRVTVVDPALTSRGDPTKERLRQYGYHEIRAELNGRMIYHQLDDLDKDGLFDELYFVTDLKARETRRVYLYLGFNDRGWNEHATHAVIGSYCRHLVPFWESEAVGWKLWYPTDCDVYAKRAPQLMSHRLAMDNLDGYGVPADMGSDIMSVADSLGGGGIVLFEDPEDPSKLSRPRFTPARRRAGEERPWNVGPVSDTRYSFDVVVNGPLRSMIRVRTLNWDSGRGHYALEQIYTAYARQSYSTCAVRFTRFEPRRDRTLFGCGIRKHPNQSLFFQEDGLVITAGSEEIVNPDDVDGLQKLKVDYVGTACIVKRQYEPEYRFAPEHGGNHTFRIAPTADLSFEYMIAAAWSEGGPFKTSASFKDYVLKTAHEYVHPVRVSVGPIERGALHSLPRASTRIDRPLGSGRR